jgi:hypothetical protein
MNYAALDPALQPWAQRHGLYILTQSHHETEVRVITIVDDSGDTYGMNLTPLDAEGQVSVTVYAAYVGRRTRFAGREQNHLFRCPISQLPETLDTAYSLAETWIRDRGHSRTPVI